MAASRAASTAEAEWRDEPGTVSSEEDIDELAEEGKVRATGGCTVVRDRWFAFTDSGNGESDAAADDDVGCTSLGVISPVSMDTKGFTNA